MTDAQRNIVDNLRQAYRDMRGEDCILTDAAILRLWSHGQGAPTAQDRLEWAVDDMSREARDNG